MKTSFSPEIITAVKNELAQLDLSTIEVDGVDMLPSQCYHFGLEPAHVLFNTNCPDTLKEKVESILSKYTQDDESSSQ
ncbi:MAG: hypothetical protein EOO05_17425 [Chitinophagaceae bacterium]|nr:MAG: hypothetical protein EOO05_17425 [Chitinophagaceae bacterium]